jgi:hypothetical protein
MIPAHAEHAHYGVFVYTAVASFITGGGLVKFLVYVSAKLPPLPKTAGWWQQFAYALVKGASGLDPNATIVPPAKT